MQLDHEIRQLAHREREILGELLPKVLKMDLTQGYLDLDFPSLFDYMTKGVGYSEGSAQRRIEAARLLREVPDLAERLESGALHLHQIGIMKRGLKSASKTRAVTTAQKRELLEKLEGQNGRESQQTVAQFFDIPPQFGIKKTAQADGSVRVELTIPKELNEKIKRTQEMISHIIPTNDLIDYIEYLTEKELKHRSVRKRSSTAAAQPEAAAAVALDHPTTRATPPAASVAKPASATATVAVKPAAPQPASLTPARRRDVLAAEPCCQHRNLQTGLICGSRWQLQVDHKTSRWLGGGHQRDNLQTLCAKHNRWKYRGETGAKPVGRYRRRTSDRSAPN